MKTLLLAILTAFLAVAAPAHAVDEHHPEKGPQAAPAKSAAAPAQTVKKMRDNLKKMDAQLNRIAKAKTDEERQVAVAEHMRTMRDNMMLARGMMADMMDCPMMQMEKKGSAMMMDGGQSDGSKERLEHMEERMDRMQMMMEQMQRRQDGQPVK
jgi:hypothetical protein